ncbi:peptidase inhibitor 16, partial [Trichonephila inaurata madagascariensis]
CDCLCADGWDAPDCSRVCEDEHKRCGVSPGFPSKASCSLNKHAVGNKYCRKMCGSCNSFNEEEQINHSCCGGKSCESGYVLDERKCKCTLLCPGLFCDTLEAKGSVTEFPKATISYVNHSENAVNLEGIEVKLKPLISSPKFEEISGRVPLQLRYDTRNHDRDRGFNQEIKKQILDLHNLYRSNVTPPAGNMAFMFKNSPLGLFRNGTKDWSTLHNSMLMNACLLTGILATKTYPHGDYGQNLYIGHDRSGYLGLWMWYEEHQHYDCKSRVCKPEEECGHYIQMAWGKSSRLGCGVRRCGYRYLIVCHYYPRALDGQQMYIIAKPCSQCSNALCRNNLCVSHEQCKINPKVCETATCNLKCQNCGLLDKRACKCACADGWDSPDCSRICKDDHQRCGMNPGFPKLRVL